MTNPRPDTNKLFVNNTIHRIRLRGAPMSGIIELYNSIMARDAKGVRIAQINYKGSPYGISYGTGSFEDLMLRSIDNDFFVTLACSHTQYKLVITILFSDLFNALATPNASFQYTSWKMECEGKIIILDNNITHGTLPAIYHNLVANNIYRVFPHVSFSPEFMQDGKAKIQAELLRTRSLDQIPKEVLMIVADYTYPCW